MIQLIFRYEWLQLCRNKFQLLLLLLTVLLGIYSIYYGFNEIQKQKQTIEQVKQVQVKQILKIQEGFNADTTTAEGKKIWQLSAVPRFIWHRHTYAAAFSPSSLAPLSIGQRDLQPYYYKLSAMSLYYQIFQNEIANPQKLLAGNFDLSFVLVYLFPLLIIAFCYGLLSSERDKGVLPLLKSQAIAIHQIIQVKLLFYFILLTSMGIVLSITGFVVSEASYKHDFPEMAAWICTLISYFIFWFSVLFIIISFNRNSAFNAIAGIGCWLLFLIIIPALINIAITVAMPLNSSVLSGISRRAGVFNEEIEENHKAVIQQFLKSYPELNSGDKLLGKNLTAKGHAAFTVLNDEKSRKLVDIYQTRVKQRDSIAHRFNLINPAVSAQNIFDAITGSNLYAFHSFYRWVISFHNQLIAFYYPKLFADTDFVKSDFLKAPQFKLQEANQQEKYIITGIIQLFSFSVILYLIGYILIKRNS